jgi:protein-disulfide isomerase
MTFERAASAILVAAALALVGLTVKREVVKGGNRRGASSAPAPIVGTRVEKWDQIQAAGRRIGPLGAHLVVAVLNDYECPFCRRFDRVLDQFTAVNEGEVATVFVDFPLPQHRFATPAARVAECAARRGRFKEMHALLFAKQDSLGLKPWAHFALATGITDTALFSNCTREASSAHPIAEGRKIADLLGATGTPTVVVNGWKLSRAPTQDELAELLLAARTRQQLFR